MLLPFTLMLNKQRHHNSAGERTPFVEPRMMVARRWWPGRARPFTPSFSREPVWHKREMDPESARVVGSLPTYIRRPGTKEKRILERQAVLGLSSVPRLFQRMLAMSSSEPTLKRQLKRLPRLTLFSHLSRISSSYSTAARPTHTWRRDPRQQQFINMPITCMHAISAFTPFC